MEKLVLDLEEMRKADTTVMRFFAPEWKLMKTVISQHPTNTDREWVALKVSLIDVINSTRLSSYRSFFHLMDVVNVILDIPSFDSRIAEGEPSVVSDLAKSMKERYGKNLFSFASKYCSYHNYFAYKKCDFSIFDTIVSHNLHKYATETLPLESSGPERWRQNFEYEAYNEYIGKLLAENGIVEPNGRILLDRLIWSSNK